MDKCSRRLACSPRCSAGDAHRTRHSPGYLVCVVGAAGRFRSALALNHSVKHATQSRSERISKQVGQLCIMVNVPLNLMLRRCVRPLHVQWRPAPRWDGTWRSPPHTPGRTAATGIFGRATGPPWDHFATPSRFSRRRGHARALRPRSCLLGDHTRCTRPPGGRGRAWIDEIGRQWAEGVASRHRPPHHRWDVHLGATQARRRPLCRVGLSKYVQRMGLPCTTARQRRHAHRTPCRQRS